MQAVTIRYLPGDRQVEYISEGQMRYYTVWDIARSGLLGDRDLGLALFLPMTTISVDRSAGPSDASSVRISQLVEEIALANVAAMISGNGGADPWDVLAQLGRLATEVAQACEQLRQTEAILTGPRVEVATRMLRRSLKPRINAALAGATVAAETPMGPSDPTPA